MILKYISEFAPDHDVLRGLTKHHVRHIKQKNTQ